MKRAGRGLRRALQFDPKQPRPQWMKERLGEGAVPLKEGDSVLAKDGKVLRFVVEKGDLGQQGELPGHDKKWVLPAGAVAEVVEVHAHDQRFVLRNPAGRLSYPVAGSNAGKLKRPAGGPAPAPPALQPLRAQREWRTAQREKFGDFDDRPHHPLSVGETKAKELVGAHPAPRPGDADHVGEMMGERWNRDPDTGAHKPHPQYKDDTPTEYLARLLKDPDALHIGAWFTYVENRHSRADVKAFALAARKRINSCLAWIHEQRRANLGDDNIDKMVFLRMNRHIE
eukprot:gene7453-17959_t